MWADKRCFHLKYWHLSGDTTLKNSHSTAANQLWSCTSSHNIRVWSTNPDRRPCLQNVKHTFVLHAVGVLHTHDCKSTQPPLFNLLFLVFTALWIDCTSAKLHLAWSCLKCSSNNWGVCAEVCAGICSAGYEELIQTTCLWKLNYMESKLTHTNTHCISYKIPGVDISMNPHTSSRAGESLSHPHACNEAQYAREMNYLNLVQ